MHGCRQECRHGTVRSPLVAGISAPAGNGAVLKEMARMVGTALGKITRLSKGKRKACVPAAARARFSAVGATEDQVNVILPVPQRLDNRGTKAEDLAGTGTHDSAGGWVARVRLSKPTCTVANIHS